MSLPSNFIDSLPCPHPKVVFERLIEGKKAKRATVWAWKNEVSPADLYCYLGARFGRPNGPQNFFRADDSDNLIHWDWVLDHPEGDLHILGMNFRTELWLSGVPDLSEAAKLELASAIKADFKNYGPQIAKVRASLEKWTEFANPYQRLSRSVEKMLADIRGLDLKPETEKLPDPTSADDPPIGDWSEILSRYSKGLGLCFGVRSMLPVMAEAYVNFLLFILMRAEYKSDERLKENALRQPIDVRVKSLHMTCVGFARPVDYASAECKAYHSLVNERNDLLHGNVVLEKLRFNEVYFHGKVPVFKEYRSMWERSVGVETGAVGLHRLEQEVQTVKSFIGYLSTCLEPEIKKKIDFMAEKRELGWNQQTGRAGVLFPDHLVDMHMSFKQAAASDGPQGNA
ncbi:hypothetical protein [Piscinibacter sp. HJYY11]|uniref:hypothetical protein n=1 Tax=Piscinibacter sp. HJYY11 TaxID=2801333 RepID=UPI00191D0A80|nr:hypothetical protein [Piscinibacter sp. HJYY11]MBL0731209.1 hypothetical protein [Piscinibacter sp. HJYY11]